MNISGIVSSVISDLNLFSAPRSKGISFNITLAKCLCPATSLSNTADACPSFSMVSLYITCGFPTLTLVLNSRCIRLMITSRWSSPIPDKIVCPVSSSFWSLSVGSSAINFSRTWSSFSWSAWVLGSTATDITGSKNSIFSNKTGWSMEQSVSPVEDSFNPITPTRLPAPAESMRSLLLACIFNMRESFSLFFREGL